MQSLGVGRLFRPPPPRWIKAEHRSAAALQGGDSGDRYADAGTAARGPGKGRAARREAPTAAGCTASRTTGRGRAGLRQCAATADCAGPPAYPERPPTANGAERAAADGAGTGARPTRVAKAGQYADGAGQR